MSLLSGLRAPSRDTTAILVAYGIALAMFVGAVAYRSTFASAGQIKFLLISAAFIGIAGIGQTLVVLTGGIDLSQPYMINVAASLTAYWSMTNNADLAKAVPAVLLIAAAVGLLNGIGVAYLSVSPIVMTLGMNSILAGTLLLYKGAEPPPAAPPALEQIALGTWGPIPINSVLWLLLILATTALLSFSAFGRRLYAVGSSRTVARIAGLPNNRVVLATYCISAISAALTGLLLLGYLGVSYVGVGDDYLFPAIAAVAIGGAALLGGRGHYLGTVAGAFVLTLVASILPLLGLGLGWLRVLTGTVIVFAVLVAGLGVTRRRSW